MKLPSFPTTFALLLFPCLVSPARSETSLLPPYASSLPDTQLLQWEGDIASRLVDTADQFLLDHLNETQTARHSAWEAHYPSDPGEQDRFLKTKRDALSRQLGLIDPRPRFASPERISTLNHSSLVGFSQHYEIHGIRWPALSGVTGEGLWIHPKTPNPLNPSRSPLVIVIPDADQSPEQLAGLTNDSSNLSQAVRNLAQSGCQIIIPTLINRTLQTRRSPYGGGGAQLTHREFLYRSSFELGRHLIGYEVQKVLALVDWYSIAEKDSKIGVFGIGEGGMLALFAGALDPRIDATIASSSFGTSSTLWQQPIDRNVFGRLQDFGDAELAAMISPRSLWIEVAGNLKISLPSKGGAPAEWTSPSYSDAYLEYLQAMKYVKTSDSIRLMAPTQREIGSPSTLAQFLHHLAPNLSLQESSTFPTPTPNHPLNPEERQTRQMEEIRLYNETLLVHSPYARKEFFKSLKTDNLDLFNTTVEAYRKTFYDEIIGRFDLPVLPPSPKTRKIYETAKWTGYEVVLDVFDGLFAYGVLLLPNDLKAGEKRPVVVCQHGLEGRPKNIIEGDHYAYHDYAAKLTEQGYITFSPQNLYIFEDRFRALQRKANLIGKTLFSLITPQHQQIVDWLQTLPQVDPQRIAFYGLSYGGKTAMRVPALVTDYCLSICSADFNEWVWKNASTVSPYSYVWTGEYEIFEFNLGGTFNYAEMATLIAPRPFMVERGHFDGVAPDETVAYEFAKVRNLYAAKLKIPERCEIEWFAGPHTINGKATFNFLNRHLQHTPHQSQ